VRSDDTVGRLSGDEFAIVLSRVAAPEDAATVAQKIVDELNLPFQLEGAELFVTASIGITVYPNDSEEQDALIRNADVAMYRAKERGRNNYQFYTPEMNRRTREMLNMEGELRRALERDEFVMHYQPKVSLATGQITGVEALLRWRHPERGLVPPGDFIPLLEETGLIVQAGERVLELVCEQINCWGRAGIEPLPVAVNLSARQFLAPDLAGSIRRVLEAHHVNPGLLEVEITESAIMTNADEAIRTLETLEALGVKTSVDDFGTGYSSLGYLKRFPLYALKIDRSFVRDITTDPDDATITQAVISMAHSLQLKVIAEGVETEAQLEFLERYGCDEVQGFLYSKPIPGDECGAMIAEDGRFRKG
jgi:EAL domain-containing protein (putative c-di-GMP-specific phosphodiesterase class I)